jgi:hypothetical protein
VAVGGARAGTFIGTGRGRGRRRSGGGDDRYAGEVKYVASVSTRTSDLALAPLMS